MPGPAADFEAALFGLVAALRLPTPAAVRVALALQPAAAEAEEAVRLDEPWTVQLVDRRFLRWTGSGRRLLDVQAGGYVETLPNPPVESTLYNLANAIRRRRHRSEEAAGGAGE